MAEFVEMPDGSVINKASIVRMRSKAEAYRVDHLDGSHYTMTEADALFLRDALLSGLLNGSEAPVGPALTKNAPKKARKGTEKTA